MKMVANMNHKGESFGSSFQKKKENRKVRFDCTGAYGLHMSPSRGAPGATQKSRKKVAPPQNLFFRHFFTDLMDFGAKMESNWLR